MQACMNHGADQQALLSMQALFSNSCLTKFWAPLQTAILHDVEQEAATSALLELLVSQLQVRASSV